MRSTPARRTPRRRPTTRSGTERAGSAGEKNQFDVELQTQINTTEDVMIGNALFSQILGHCRPRKFVLLGTAVAVGVATSPSRAQQIFHTPSEAAAAFAGAARVGDRTTLLKILGPQGAVLVSSGDSVADAADRHLFVAAFDAKHQVAKIGDGKAMLIVGREDYPFPIPLVQKGDGWQFDVVAGKQEILYRRIGRNELNTIQSCLAYVDAQNEYAEKDRTGAGVGIYAGRIISQPNQKDGLYWPGSETGDESPLGELVARATAQGYRTGEGRAPYHGYYFKILTRQGPNATGGALDYVVGGRMIGGFALVAYPAEYGNTGVMTFIVNHQGIVFQKDLGRRTTVIAQRMVAFNPDATWKKAEPPVASR
jgi:hypothetical protein